MVGREAVMAGKVGHEATRRNAGYPAGEGELMRAAVRERYGDAGNLHIAQIKRPQIKGDEVLVKVGAAGLDRGTWHMMTGRPYLMRLVFGLRRPRDPVLGLDLAGTVAAVGGSVTRFHVGDEVFGTGRGTFAGYAAAKETRLALKPAGLSFSQAAVVPVSAVTALQGLRDAGRVQAGHKVLVTGASGGVGSYAVQLAKSFGADVTGVCSTSKMDLLRSLGADHVIDYSRDDFADGGQHYDLILDFAGNPSLSRLRGALTPNGTAVIGGGEQGGNVTGLGRQLRAVAVSPFVGQRLVMFASVQRGADLEHLAGLIHAGKVVPCLDRTFPLDQVEAAMRYLEGGKVRGKVAITP